MNLKKYDLKNGQITLQLLIFGVVVILFLSGFLIWLDTISKSTVRSFDNYQAFQIAEAGIDYYRWHLAHAPEDYQDGTTSTGPYTHNYYDKNGNLIGEFILDITPPPVGSTIVTINSAGRLFSEPTVEKIIEVKMGIASLAKYALVLNDNTRFGQGTEVFGAIHSNKGVRFDGLAHNLVTSALNDYDDPDHTGANEFGVHTHVNPPPGSGVDDTFRPNEAPPTNPVPTRNDVFLAGRSFPVPAVDFTGITQDLSEIRAEALATGFHASSSGVFGYDVVFRTDNKFELYRVTSLVVASSGCTNALGQDGWGTWSIASEAFVSTNDIPANGLIFLEDNVWVRGQIDESRATVVSAVFPDNPTTRTSITINDNLLYTNYDGRDVISLISQKNINIGMVSLNTLRVDAALVAQNGRVGRYYYRPPNGGNRCSPYHTRNQITTYGMIASNLRYGFAYTNGTGYQLRNIIYDSNLLYGPPPSFPLTAEAYETISWDEIQ